MNWKLKLSFALILIAAATVLLKLPSQADTDANFAAGQQRQKSENAGGEASSASGGKITEYPNGVSKIEPTAFAVSGKVRDMPTVDENALVKSASFKDAEERREERIARARRKNGEVTTDAEEAGEINRQNAERVKKIMPGAGLADKNFQDPLLADRQSQTLPESPDQMPEPSLTFDGATQADNNSQGYNVLPPDVNGDVGPNHYVSSVNLVLKIFSKSGALLKGPIRTNSLFAALPAGDPCRVLNDGDPIVLYDSLADRWHISQFGLPAGNKSYQCIALSVTGDPTGAYYVWSYTYPLPSSLNDYPKVGVWTDGYHMTFNQFNSAGDKYEGAGLLTQDRKKALAGDPTAAAVYVNIGAIDPNSGGTLPGDIDGYVGPPPGLAEIIGEYRADEFGDPIDGLRIYKWIPNFDNPNNSVLTVLPDLQLAPFDARQPNTSNQIEVMGAATTQYLDSVADRSMHRFAYRNFGTTANPINSYAGNFAVNVSGVNPTTASTYQTGIRWFEIRRVNDTFSVFDQGTHNLTPGDGANGLNNWMGSIAQDNRGDIALGFSQAGTGQKADIKIAGRTNNVQGSGTLNEGETLMHPAGGVQTSTSGRWGDYSSMSIDPSDDCTFWYTQEYYAATSDRGWSTRIGKFRFPQCADAPKATITGTITYCEGGAPLVGAAVDATGGFNRITGAGGTYSLIVSPGTYTVTAGKSAGFIASGQNATVSNGETARVNICLTGVPVIVNQSAPIVSESCGIANGAPDPGEQITVSLPLQNTGRASAANLTATLQATGGVTNPTNAAQSYGTLAPGSAATIRNFTFTVDPSLICGANVTLTFNLTDGANNYGTVKKTYSTGVRSTTPTLTESFDGVSAPALPAGWSSVQIIGTSINWTTSTATPNSAPNDAFANEPVTPGAAALVSPAVSVLGTDAQISFKTYYNVETFYDGMVFEYSTDGGSTWTDILAGGGSFLSGGYNDSISAVDGSPIAGRAAWTGTSGGYVTTLAQLPASLNGQTVRFRWVNATDTGTSVEGVRIDDVKIFASRQCNTCAVSNVCRFQRRFDFDGDNKADVSIYRPAEGNWYISNSGSGGAASVTRFGLASDKIVPADYDGDGKIDVAIYRPSEGNWYLLRSRDGFGGVHFGNPEDIPQPADFDGDGKSELAVYRPSTGEWYVFNLVNSTFTGVKFGVSTDKPVVGDYDGDCKADYAIYRPAEGNWYLMQSRDGFNVVKFGVSTDVPVTGDYDGDGKSDETIYRPSEGNWYLQRSSIGFGGAHFGIATDIPAAADYDGDGKADIAVYRPGEGAWYQLNTQSGFQVIRFGISTDKPVPNAFVP